MTGFESWCLAGIERGVKWLVDLAGPDLDLSIPEARAELASRVMEHWPMWKRAYLQRKDLPLDTPVAGADRPYFDRDRADGEPGREGIQCKRCDIVTDRLTGTPYGNLCLRCLTLYIDRKWPEEQA